MQDLSLNLKILLKFHNIQLDWDEFSFQFKSHPSYPSLHAATGALDHFNIENVAARVPTNLETLNQLPKSCIIQINENNQMDLVLLKKQKDEFIIFKGKNTKQKINSKELLEQFTGVVLAVENDNRRLNKSHKRNYIIEIASVVAIACLVSIFIIKAYPPLFYIYLILSFAGVLVSISILQQEFGQKSFIGEALCSSESVKKDCNAILNSKGANVLGKYKLSNLSIIYFSGFILSLVLLQLQDLSLTALHLLSLISLPITIYSIYYQAKIAKTWCGLCLGIVSVLWMLAVAPFLLNPFQISVNIFGIELLAIVLSFSLAFYVWSLLKSQYIDLRDARIEKLEYHRFKKNIDVFSALLTNKTPIDPHINSAEKEIVLGNPNSRVNLLVVTSPFCGHCKPVHTMVEDLLVKYKNKISITIRFNINISQPKTDLINLCAHLQYIYKTHPNKIIDALDDAYNKLKYKDWIGKWAKAPINRKEYLELFTQQKNWCQTNNINFTPYLDINGYSYPKEYDREDLRFFMQDLIEDSVELFQKQDQLKTAI